MAGDALDDPVPTAQRGEHEPSEREAPEAVELVDSDLVAGDAERRPQRAQLLVVGLRGGRDVGDRQARERRAVRGGDGIALVGVQAAGLLPVGRLQVHDRLDAEAGLQQLALELVGVAQQGGGAVLRRRRRHLAGGPGADGAQPVGRRGMAVIGIGLALGDLRGDDRVDLRADVVVGGRPRSARRSR